MQLYRMCLFVLALPLCAAPTSVTFSQSSSSVEAYDFLEVTVNVSSPDARSPFADAAVTGWFAKTGQAARIFVEGFCDSADGSVFRIRFMPSAPGDYEYSVAYRQGNFDRTYKGTFGATDGRRRGPIRVDPKYPWHFIWEGTGEHYFFNGTTAFWLVGWRDERIINESIERLHRLKVNRLRVFLHASTDTFWGEPVMADDMATDRWSKFTTFLRPWMAEAPNSFDRPGIDYTRFNVPHWQKWERMLRFARSRDMIISVIQDTYMHKVQPAAGSEDERRYLRYAVARLSAFSNITWDLGDDLNSFRDEKWTRETGTLLVGWDPYKHLATSHPTGYVAQDRSAAWFGFTSIQHWGRNQHQLMLEQRQMQIKTGRIIPQANEEYGFEDHYPRWAPPPPGNSAETLRRTAWDIAMAGCYGTAGESARRGVNIWPDTGGGWLNGRGDDTMVMLKGYAYMVDFFTSFEWWKTEPHDELVDSRHRGYCLAKPGEIYAVYLPYAPEAYGAATGREVTVKLEPGRYEATWFDPLTGHRIPAGEAQGPVWKSPRSPGWNDWALLLQRRP